MQSFEAQVEALTSLSIDGSSAPTQTELSDFLSDGAIDVINSMPSRFKYLCATEDTFTSQVVGSESKVLKSGNVLSVTRAGEPCREIPANQATRASDNSGIASSHMEVATATDPVFYIYNGKINALPSGGECKYLEINRPGVLYTHDSMDDSVASFPLEYEYLVPLYASVKALQNAMAAKSGNTSISSSLTALNQCIINAGTEIGLAKVEAGQLVEAADKFSGAGTSADPALLGNEAVYTTGEGLKKVNEALDVAISYVNGNFPDANYDLVQNFSDIDDQIDDEDTELAAARVQQAQTTMSAISTQINLAQAHIADFNTALSALQAEIGSFSSGIQGYINTASSYLSQASANANEIQVRLSVDTTEYGWMEKQQVKLQSDYDKGIIKMTGQTA
jgi:hypothetical protein